MAGTGTTEIEYTTEIEDTENGVEKDQQQRGTVGHHQRSTLTIKKNSKTVYIVTARLSDLT